MTLDKYIRNGYSIRMATANTNLPLTPAVFHILLALSTGDRHGYLRVNMTRKGTAYGYSI